MKLTATQRRSNNCTARFTGSRSALLEKAIRIGELLAEQKETMAHGEWLPWLADKVPSSERTARNYMRLYDQRAELKKGKIAALSAAYKMMAVPDAPPPPRPATPPAGSNRQICRFDAGHTWQSGELAGGGAVRRGTARRR